MRTRTAIGAERCIVLLEGCGPMMRTLVACNATTPPPHPRMCHEAAVSQRQCEQACTHASREGQHTLIGNEAQPETDRWLFSPELAEAAR